MCLWRFCHHMQSEGGPSAYPVPRNSTSNWAIATSLTRVYSCTLCPKHTPIGLKMQLQPLLQESEYLIKSRFYLFLCFLWAPRWLYLLWMWNSHFVQHQCSITNLKEEPALVLSCYKGLRLTRNPSLWRPCGLNELGLLNTRVLPTGAWKHRAQY